MHESGPEALRNPYKNPMQTRHDGIAKGTLNEPKPFRASLYKLLPFFLGNFENLPRSIIQPYCTVP